MNDRGIPASYFKAMQPHKYHIGRGLPESEYLDFGAKGKGEIKYIPKKERTQELCLKLMERLGYNCFEEWVRDEPSVFPYLAAELYTEELCIVFFDSGYPSEHFSHGSWDKGIPMDYGTLPFKYYMKWASVCKIAVSKNGLQLAGVPKKWMTQEICDIAFEQHSMCFQYIPEKFMREEYCNKALSWHPGHIKFIPDQLLTQELCDLAYSKQKTTIQFIPEKYRTKEMLEDWIKSPYSKIPF